MPRFHRVLLKVSGEALAGKNGFGLDFGFIDSVCEQVKKCIELGTQVAIVVGGGNFWRGRSSGSMDRTRADQMGMLATAINALAISDTLISKGIPSKVESALALESIAERFNRDRAVALLNQGGVVVFSCGVGSPYFSTDTCACLRAAEIGADCILKATMVDGVYDKDPRNNPDAKRYDIVSISEVLEKHLSVIDMTAASLCKDNGLTLYVFSLADPENIFRAVNGESVGTTVKE